MSKIKQKTKNVRINRVKDTSALPIIERRRYIRHPLSIPLTYRAIKGRADKNQKGTPSTTLNISIGGLLFTSKRPIQSGSMIMLKMPFENKVFHISSKVVHCAKDSETKLYNVGVSFYRFRDAYKVKLLEQIYLIAEYRDLRSIQLGREVSLEEASVDWIKRYSERFKRLYW